MNLNDFRYIIAVAEAGSFSKAAEELFITQPALSQRVRYIERVYDVTLFDRERTGMTLTDDGEVFVKYARALLKCDSDLRAEYAQRKQEQSAGIRLGISYAIGDLFYQHMFPRMCAALPWIRFNVVEQSSPVLEQQLLSDQIDFMICYTRQKKTGFNYENILEDSFVLLPAANSELEKLLTHVPPKSKIDPQLLNGKPVSVCMPGRFLYQYLQSVIETEQIHPNICLMGESLKVLYSAAESGNSAAFLYESFLLNQPHRPYYYLDSKVNNALLLTLAWKKKSVHQKDAVKLAKSIQSEIGSQALVL